MKFPKFNRPKRKDDALYNAQLADLERYEGKPLTQKSLDRIQRREFGTSNVKEINGHQLKQINRKEFLKIAGLTGLLSAGAALLSKVPIANAPSAPSTGWNLDSGSMVLPMTYCAYVDPVGPTFLGRNGLTGANDFSEISAGTLFGTDIFPALTRSAWIHAKSGDYPMGTSSPAAVLGRNIKFTGEGSSPDYSASATFPLNKAATRFLPGVNNQTLFQATTLRNVPILNWVFEDMLFDSNGFTGGVGIDMTNTATENETNGVMNRIGVTNMKNDFVTANGNWATVIIVDGMDDVNITKLTVIGNTGVARVTTNAVVQASLPNGDIAIRDSVLIDGTLANPGVSVVGNWILGEFGGGISTFDQIKLNATNTPRSHTYIHDLFWGYQLDNFNVNGQAAGALAVINAWIRNASTTRFIFLNAGTLDHLQIESSRMESPSSAGLFTDSALNVGRYSLYAKGVESTAYSSVAPFTLNTANGISYLGDPGYTVATPAFPGSGVDVQNSLGFPLIVYITGVGGGITAYTIKDPNGNIVSFTRTVNVGDAFTVGRGSKINFTSSGSPTWKWFGFIPN